MNAKLTLSAGAYDDGTWYVATVLTYYDDRGRASAPRTVSSRVVDSDRVREIGIEALDYVIRHAQVEAALRNAGPENASKPTQRRGDPRL